MRWPISADAVNWRAETPHRRPRWWVGLVAVTALLGCTEADTGDEAAFCERIVSIPVPRQLDDLRIPTPELASEPILLALEEALVVAPPEVHPDVAAMVEAVEAVRDALVERETDDGTGAEANLTQRLDEFALASDRVVGYTRSTCGVDLEAVG